MAYNDSKVLARYQDLKPPASITLKLGISSATDSYPLSHHSHCSLSSHGLVSQGKHLDLPAPSFLDT